MFPRPATKPWSSSSGFTSRLRFAHPFEENPRGEHRVERFRPESPEDPLGIGHEIDPPELAGVVKPEFTAVFEGKHHVLVGEPLRAGGNQVEPARHAQMHEQVPAAGKIDHQELAAPADRGDLFFLDEAAEFRHGGLGDRAIPVDPGAGEGLSDEAGRVQISCDCFDFGQFRHKAK